MNKKAIGLFIRDYASLILITFTTQVLFFGILFFLKGVWFKEFLYFSFLVFVVILLYLSVRFYRRKGVYEKIILNSIDFNDYLIEDPKSSFEIQFNRMIENLIKIRNNDRIKVREDKKLQKVMVYRFVHQMKTPVSVLKLICENHYGEDDYKIIAKNIKSIQHNLDQMLDVYKLEEFKNDFVAEKISLNEICKECINSLKDYFITSGVFPRLDVDREVYVYSDSKWLKLLISQLLTNAVKYSDRGQSVIISISKYGEKVMMKVIDKGIGINKAEQPKIFELFYTGKNGRNNADSSGLGLYIAKRISDYLGHEIQVDSEPDKGSTFTVIF